MADPTAFTTNQVTAALAALGVDAGLDLQSIVVTPTIVQINRSLGDEAGSTHSATYTIGE